MTINVSCNAPGWGQRPYDYNADDEADGAEPYASGGGGYGQGGAGQPDYPPYRQSGYAQPYGQRQTYAQPGYVQPGYAPPGGWTHGATGNAPPPSAPQGGYDQQDAGDPNGQYADQNPQQGYDPAYDPQGGGDQAASLEDALYRIADGGLILVTGECHVQNTLYVNKRVSIRTPSVAYRQAGWTPGEARIVKDSWGPCLVAGPNGQVDFSGLGVRSAMGGSCLVATQQGVIWFGNGWISTQGPAFEAQDGAILVENATIRSRDAPALVGQGVFQVSGSRVTGRALAVDVTADDRYKSSFSNVGFYNIGARRRGCASDGPGTVGLRLNGYGPNAGVELFDATVCGFSTGATLGGGATLDVQRSWIVGADIGFESAGTLRVSSSAINARATGAVLTGGGTGWVHGNVLYPVNGAPVSPMIPGHPTDNWVYTDAACGKWTAFHCRPLRKLPNQLKAQLALGEPYGFHDLSYQRECYGRHDCVRAAPPAPAPGPWSAGSPPPG
ncbi:MAG: hypothetical protein ACXWVJ_09085 [Caulobacteraceae bacterium]